MNIQKLLLGIFLLTSLNSISQNVAINTDGSAPDNSAILDVKGNRGMLIPRMTEAERTAIPSPANGLLVYQTNNADGFYYNKGTAGSSNWQPLGTYSSSGGIVVYNGTTGGAISHTITDLSIRTIIVTYNGGSGAASSVDLTLPAASSYPAGTILSISVTAYVTANPSWTIISPSSTYNALNYNNITTAGGVAVGATNGFRLVANGNSWYRVLGS